jgi:TolA-binding protein
MEGTASSVKCNIDLDGAVIMGSCERERKIELLKQQIELSRKERIEQLEKQLKEEKKRIQLREQNKALHQVKELRKAAEIKKKREGPPKSTQSSPKHENPIRNPSTPTAKPHQIPLANPPREKRKTVSRTLRPINPPAETFPTESSKTQPNTNLPPEHILLSVLCPEIASCENVEPLYENDTDYIWNVLEIINQAQCSTINQLKCSPNIKAAVTHAVNSKNHLGVLLFLDHVCSSEMAYCLAKRNG